MPEQINTVKQSKIQVAAREAERLRIAQDLHDAFGGNLTGASMLLAKIASQFPHPSGEQADTLAQLRTLLADSRRKLQQVIYDLRPPEMASGLIPALRQLCSQWQACSGLECDLLLANINDEKNVDDDLHAEHMRASIPCSFVIKRRIRQSNKRLMSLSHFTSIQRSGSFTSKRLATWQSAMCTVMP
jgi:signal transduction histidine kinase